MKFTLSPLRDLSLALCAGLAMHVATAAPVAQASDADAQARYKQDRAACLSGQSNEDRATCLKEAGAALAEARRGNLTDESHAQLRKNAKERCDALTGADHKDCVDRMKGEGTVSGSVEGGGILREKVTIEPAPSGVTAK